MAAQLCNNEGKFARNIFNCAGDRRSARDAVEHYQVRLSGCASVLKTTLSKSKEEVKIFECLGQDEALHFIALLLGHDIGKRGVAATGAAIFHEVLKICWLT